MSYETYFNSTKSGDEVLNLIEWEQSLEGSKELAVYTLTDDARAGSRWGEVTTFVLLANTIEEAKRLVAFNSYPNNISAACELYGNLQQVERHPVAAGVGLIDYVKETIGL